MHHIDEHTLELYVLNAKEVAEKRQEIEAHLAECHGCRSLVDEMTGFYDDLKTELEKEPAADEAPSTALVRRHVQVEPYYEPFAPPVPYQRPTTFIGKFQYFVRRHPVTTGIGSFATVGILAAAMMFGLKDFFKDTNPAYTHYNTGGNFIEVYNKHDDLLWQLPSGQLSWVQNCEFKHEIKQTQVYDLDGDGFNEVITIERLDQDGSNPVYPLRVFDAKKNLRWKRSFVQEFHYLDRSYSPQFGINSFVVTDRVGSKTKDVIANITNGRSPSFVVRLDNNGNELGEYWHFGSLTYSYLVDLKGDGRKEIVLLGINDLQDSTHEEYGIIIVLDPEKIVGRKSATIVQGFGLPPSDAEMFYVRIPRSDMNEFIREALLPQRMRQPNSNSIIFWCQSKHMEESDDAPPQFEFFFTSGMQVTMVKSGNVTDKYHDSLVVAGKLTGKIDQAYLENLKNAVRYWDGKEWRKEVTMVQHTNETATQKY